MEHRILAAGFEREAVRQARQPGALRAMVAQELDLNANMQSRLVQQFGSGIGNPRLGKPIKGYQKFAIERLQR